MTAVVRIGLVDDRLLYREGLKQILGTIDDFDVVGEAEDVYDAVDVMPDEKPDVILLHVRLPDGAEIASVCHLCDSFPESRIIVLSMFEWPEMLIRLSRMGVSGYLTNATRLGLVAAIRCSLEREDQILLSVSRESLAHLPVVVTPSPLAPMLTPRELEILSLTSQALSNTQIARQLFLTEATVKRHLRNIFSKLGAVSRIDAVNKAIASRLLPLPAHGTTVPRS